MTEPKAEFDKPVNTDKWRVKFLSNFILVKDKDDARQISDIINIAYQRGRSDVQSELRSIIGAASEKDWDA